MAMTDAQIDKWQDALRSGRYQQARRHLMSRSGGLCCIGVGATEFGTYKCKPDLRGDGEYGDGTSTYDAAHSFGLTSDRAKELEDANDMHGLTFPEIADLIEFMREELKS